MSLPKPTLEELKERADIDRSTRYPVMFFFTSSAAWLLVATVLGFLSSVKLTAPGLGDGWAILGYGRLFPAHLNSLVYGWAMQAGIGVMLWLLARLSRSPVRNAAGIIVAGHVWNAGVGIAVLAILFGFGTSIPLLDFPAWVWPILAFSYLLVVVWALPLARRRQSSLYISEMYLVGAAVWFPWVFFTANIVIGRESAPVMGSGVAAWYLTNVIYFWMAPIALAVAYYIIPKIAGRPVYSYPLAHLSFWLFAALAGWTGFSRFMGGPFPAWMPAASSAAAIFLLLPIVLTVVNLMLTLKGCSKLWEISPSLRFTVFGVLMLAIYGFLAAVSATFVFGKNLQFSHFVVGLDTLAFYGFFSMTVFGAIYFIVPRVTESEWPSGQRIRTHFWFSAYGILTLATVMLVGGIAQGGDLAVWDREFSVSYVNASGPTYAVGRSIAWALISVSNYYFLLQLALMYLGKGRKTEGPTLLHTEPGAAPSAKAAAGL